MAAPSYFRFKYSQDGAEDYLSGVLMTSCEAYEVLGISALVHRLSGWSVELHGNGFTASRDGVRRAETLIPAGGDGEGEDRVPALSPVQAVQAVQVALVGVA